MYERKEIEVTGTFNGASAPTPDKMAAASRLAKLAKFHADLGLTEVQQAEINWVHDTIYLKAKNGGATQRLGESLIRYEGDLR